MASTIGQIYQDYWSYFVATITDTNAMLNPFYNERGNYFYLLIYVSILVWILEIALPWRKNQKIIRAGFWMDAFYMFFNFFLFSLIIYSLLSNVTEYWFGRTMSAIGLPKRGWFDLGKLWLPLQFLVFFLINDFVQWVVHVILHRVPILWRFHKVHHSVREMGFAAHLRYHFMETIFYKTAQYIVLAWLFHFHLEYAFYLHAFTILIGHLNHANVGWDYGSLKYVFNNPKMHIWHHAKVMPDTHPNGINFGITLSLWDYLFNTAHIPSSGRDIELGFEGIEEYPTSFLQHIITPFKWKK
jgi:sterol desaturase/sphingolipid hydroxylase (fatty acid hydroxylase superfamily)